MRIPTSNFSSLVTPNNQRDFHSCSIINKKVAIITPAVAYETKSEEVSRAGIFFCLLCFGVRAHSLGGPHVDCHDIATQHLAAFQSGEPKTL
jgi:hypothetical protein